MIAAKQIAQEQLNFGASPEERSQQALVVQSLIDSLFRHANEESVAGFIFGGAAAGQRPVEELLGGYRSRAVGNGITTDLGRAALHHRAPLRGVAVAVEQQTLGRQPVAAGAPGLLLVVLDALRHRGVDDEPYVAAIDPHAERDRGDDDVEPFGAEVGADRRAFAGTETRVVGARVDAAASQRLGERLGVLPADAVDDRGAAGRAARRRRGLE